MKVRLKIRTLPCSAQEIYVIGMAPSSPSCENDLDDINKHGISTESIKEEKRIEDERSGSNPSTSTSSDLEWVMGTFETIKTERNEEDHSDDSSRQSLSSSAEPEVVDVDVESFPNHISSISINQIQSSGIRSTVGSKRPRQWKCPECDKKFNQRAFLDAHRRSHLNIRPFVCQYCQKSFTQAGNLKMHMRVHDGLKPYTCGQCGRAFSQKGNLQQHIMTHEGRKPFECTICGKAFTQKGNLKSHVQRHNEFTLR